MRKLLTWLAVTIGVATLLRKLRGRPREESFSAPDVDPADELRRTLADRSQAETREDEMPVPGFPPGPEPAIDEPPVDEPTVDDRRAAVHEQGRAAIEEMQVSEGEPSR